MIASNTTASAASDGCCLNVASRNDLLPINLNTFEVLHLGTYHPDLLSSYVKCAAALEVELTLAKQSQREAFNPQESDEAAARLSLLSSQQQLLEEAWRPMRWLYELLSLNRFDIRELQIIREHHKNV